MKEITAKVASACERFALNITEHTLFFEKHSELPLCSMQLFFRDEL